MTHLLHNYPPFFGSLISKSVYQECWFARQLSSPSIYWFNFFIDV